MLLLEATLFLSWNKNAMPLKIYYTGYSKNTNKQTNKKPIGNYQLIRKRHSTGRHLWFIIKHHVPWCLRKGDAYLKHLCIEV